MSNSDQLEAVVLDQVENCLYLLNEEMTQNKSIHLENYRKQFLSLLALVNEKQRLNIISSVGIIAFVLSRIQVDGDSFFYKVNLYPDKLYCDGYRIDLDLDVANVYRYFSQCRNKIREVCQGRPYPPQAIEIDGELNKYTHYFNMYVVRLLREAIAETEVLDQMAVIRQSPALYIIQHEIYEKPYLIYKNDKKVEV